MKAGNYYIGDLCCVLDKCEWQQACDILEKTQADDISLKVGNKIIALLRTRVGDGIFYDDYSRGHAVDSGMIGCMLLEHIVGFPNWDIASSFLFMNDFVVYYDEAEDRIKFADLITNELINSIYVGFPNWDIASSFLFMNDFVVYYDEAEDRIKFADLITNELINSIYVGLDADEYID